jgi:hypothetical protein
VTTWAVLRLWETLVGNARSAGGHAVRQADRRPAAVRVVAHTSHPGWRETITQGDHDPQQVCDHCPAPCSTRRLRAAFLFPFACDNCFYHKRNHGKRGYFDQENQHPLKHETYDSIRNYTAGYYARRLASAVAHRERYAGDANTHRAILCLGL